MLELCLVEDEIVPQDRLTEGYIRVANMLERAERLEAEGHSDMARTARHMAFHLLTQLRELRRSSAGPDVIR